MVILFYKYTKVTYPKQLQKWQLRLCSQLALRGRIIIAHEGINGTLGGSDSAIEAYKAALTAHELFTDIDIKESAGSAADFPRLSVLVKPEIVNLGLSPELVSPADGGRHLSPAEAHALCAEAPEDLVLLDGRNAYESAIGAFEGAITPPINHFREFPQYVDTHLDQFKDKRVLMYCTGGVRCERASAYLKQKQVAKEVLQIQGGIHRYAEQFPNGFFRGKNYVFDKRVTVSVTDDIVGTCVRCAAPCERYHACAVATCHSQLLACTPCAQELRCVTHSQAVETRRSSTAAFVTLRGRTKTGGNP